MLSISFISLFRRFSALAVAVVGIGFLANVSVTEVYAQESTLADQTLTQECIEQPYSGTMHQSSEADLALEIEKTAWFKTVGNGMTADVLFVTAVQVKVVRGLA